MVETEKVYSHKVPAATTNSELDHHHHHHQRKSPVGNVRFVTTPSKEKQMAVEEKFTNERNMDRPSITRSASAYYVFSSLPQVVRSVRPKTGYRNNVSRPRGAHDYFNVMWDPHIYRGTTTTLTSSLKQPDADLSNRDQERYRRRRQAFLTGTGQKDISYSNHDRNSSNGTNHLNPVGVMGPGSNRNRYRMTTKVSSRSKTFPPPEGRHQVQVQTEDYLEDLSRDATNKASEVDAIVQTDPIEDMDFVSSTLTNSGSGKGSHLILPRSGIDASTQVLPGELITFDERVQPIVEAVVGKILEQALLETMEEEEIGALKAQQNRFLEKRKEEERELKRLKEQQERISAEKERIKRHLEIQLARQQQQQQQQSQNGDSDDAQLSSSATTSGMLMMGNGNNIETSVNNANAMSTSYLLELLPSVINSLRQEGLITDQIGDEVFTSLSPLWMGPASNQEETSNENDATNGMGDGDGDAEDNSDPFPDGYNSRVSSPNIVDTGKNESPTQTEEEENEEVTSSRPTSADEVPDENENEKGVASESVPEKEGNEEASGDESNIEIKDTVEAEANVKNEETTEAEETAEAETNVDNEETVETNVENEEITEAETNIENEEITEAEMNVENEEITAAENEEPTAVEMNVEGESNLVDDEEEKDNTTEINSENAETRDDSLISNSEPSSSTLPSQLPNGAIPNIESRDE